MREKSYETPLPEDSEFTFYWNLFVDDVVARENFKLGHLQQLKILCKLYRQFHDNTNQLEEEGYSFASSGRNGHQLKPNPICAIRDKCLAEIRQYSRLLGLVLEKDTTKKDSSENNEWLGDE